MTVLFTNRPYLSPPLRQVLEFVVLPLLVPDLDFLLLLFMTVVVIKVKTRDGLVVILAQGFLLHFAGALLVDVGVHFVLVHFQFMATPEYYEGFLQTHGIRTDVVRDPEVGL